MNLKFKETTSNGNTYERIIEHDMYPSSYNPTLIFEKRPDNQSVEEYMVNCLKVGLSHIKINVDKLKEKHSMHSYIRNTNIDIYDDVLSIEFTFRFILDATK